MKTTLSQVCSLDSPFEVDVEGYGAGGCRSLEVWLTKLEAFLKKHSLADVKSLCRDHQIEMPVASFQGGLLTSQGEARSVAWELFDRRIELCSSLEISTLVVACDIHAPINQQDIDRARTSLQQAARASGEKGVRIALEFQARAAFGNNLQTAAALIDEVNNPYLGICLDAFHFHVGPSKHADLAYLTNENLFHVQLSDLVDTPREFATDSDRILPGDGDFDLASLISYLRSIDYSGCVSMELMNTQIWQIPARQFGEIAMSALGKLCENVER